MVGTHITCPMTSGTVLVNFSLAYDHAPVVFGMLGSLNRLTDSTALRSIQRTPTYAYCITQEDQCVNEQTQHTTPESAFAFVVGASPFGHGNDVVPFRFIAYNSGQPSGVPSSAPTVSCGDDVSFRVQPGCGVDSYRDAA